MEVRGFSRRMTPANLDEGFVYSAINSHLSPGVPVLCVDPKDRRPSIFIRICFHWAIMPSNNGVF